MQNLKTLGLAAAFTALSVGGVLAQAPQTGTIYAQPANFPGDVSGVTAQVGTTGPSSSSTYLDIEGAGNGTKFESFGVIDFLGNTIPDAFGNAETIASVDPIVTLSLTDQSFSQSRPGTLNFYLADGTAALSSLKYDPTVAGGVGTQLGNLYYLGTTNSAKGVAGTVYPYSLTLPAAAQSIFANRLDTGGPLRFVLEADNSTEVAAFAGSGGGNTGGVPALTFTVTPAAVPEASTTVSFGVLLALGLGGLAVARRRRAA